MLNKYYEAQEKPELKLVPFADAGSAESNEKAVEDRQSPMVKIEGYMEFKAGCEGRIPGCDIQV